MSKNEIKELINKWFSKGVISQEQADYMVKDIKVVSSEKSGKKFINMIMYIGAFALSLGALLLIASNWSYMPKGMKLVLSLLLPIAPIVFAYWQLSTKGAMNTLGRAANFLGLFLAGGSMALIGQIYHLEIDMQLFVILWTLLTIPLIFVFKKPENIVFSIIIVGVSILISIIKFSQSFRIDEGTGILILTLLLLLYSYIVYTIGVRLRNVMGWSDNGRLMRIMAGSLTAVTLFLTTFEFYARIVTHSNYYNNTGSWIAVSMLLNFIFIGFLIFALMRGIKHEEHGFAFSIMRLFGIYLLTKYITLFSTMMDTGLFLIMGGVLFISGGYLLEKKKGFLVSYMEGAEDDNQIQSHE